MSHARFFTPLLAAALGASPAFADMQIRETRTDSTGAVLGERLTAVSANRLRIDEGDLSCVVDLAAGKMMLLDHKTKTWRERSLAADKPDRRTPTADATTQKWQSRTEALAAAVEDLRLLRVVPTSETKTIAGVVAKRVDLFDGLTKVRESWHAASVPADDINTVLLKIAERDPSIMVRSDMNTWQQTVHLGYAVLVRDLERGVTMEAKEIKTGAVPAQRFAVPSGYRKSE
ncbi:MAG TPA: hypothetical protein VEN28_04505 [Burkholderiaceae bacterium]|nr:hypothetical protein [Burkholderiaceae bacterium]